MENDVVSICKYCWITVKSPPEAKRTVGKSTDLEYWVHSAIRDEVGNPYCGRNRLLESDLDYLTHDAESSS